MTRFFAVGRRRWEHSNNEWGYHQKWGVANDAEMESVHAPWHVAARNTPKKPS